VSQKTRNMKRLLMVGAMSGVAAAFGASPAIAQDIEAVAVGEVGGDDVHLLLLEGTARATRLGMSPTFTVQGYLVTFPDGEDGTATAMVVTPFVGLRWLTQSGALSARAGYAFRSDDLGIPFFGGSEDGLVTGLQADYWGQGSLGLQAIASYNWPAEYLWSRARATIGFRQATDGTIAGGLEAVWQGDVSELAAYRVTQIGPVLQWAGRSGFVAAVGAGWKDTAVTGEFEPHGQTWYAKMEMVVPVVSRR
jgi:hypothetical protein